MLNEFRDHHNQPEDGKTKIQTRLENETVWHTQEQISEAFSERYKRNNQTQKIENTAKQLRKKCPAHSLKYTYK